MALFLALIGLGILFYTPIVLISIASYRHEQFKKRIFKQHPSICHHHFIYNVNMGG